MPPTLHLNGQEILPGQTRDIYLEIAQLPTHTPMTMPIRVFRAREDGPVLLLLAGMHGDEINGLEIIRRIMADKRIRLVRGSVVAVPLVNVFGFLHLSRDTPDGKDVNRSFPGSAQGSLAARLAHSLLTHILPLADYCIDFHTGGASRSNHPQVRLDMKAQPEGLPLAHAFAAPLLLNSKLVDKSFRKEAALRGKPVLVYEGGESLRLDEQAVQEGIDGTLRVMKHLGMLPEAPAPQTTTVTLADSTWIRARKAGLFRPLVHNGEYVRKHALMGTLADPYGLTEISLKAPHDGWIISTNYLPVVNQGDALWHFGEV
ncbi:MAG: succinylglutamate desuccinylase/aspartoacylase family protein [Bacteroidetes bacterium]|nr:succinylglutamate desuccinylase/aspartoacylase family protein [Bacteroidota bacterium]